MGKYLHLFETTAQFDAVYNGENYLEPWVSLTEDVDRVDYNKMDEWEYVDLGLSSGTLWATCNLGASSPEQYGDYYAWGEVETKDETAYTFEDYRFYDGDKSEYNKYNSTDNKMTLDLTDDAANVVMGGDWHMPSRAQLEELTANANTTSSWTTDYNGTGVSGVVFTSNINGNSIFFPAAGGVFDGSAEDQGVYFVVWSSSRNSLSYYAWGLNGSSDDMYMNSYYRYFGLSVRGVLGELNDEGGGADPSNPVES